MLTLTYVKICCRRGGVAFMINCDGVELIHNGEKSAEF